jgi:hypothetical protein
MKVVIQTPTPKKKTINQIANGQAFRWGECWFIRVNLNDECIRNFGDFYDKHVLKDMSQARDYNTAVPVLALGGQSLCYVNGEIEVDAWGTLEALITTAL